MARLNVVTVSVDYAGNDEEQDVSLPAGSTVADVFKFLEDANPSKHSITVNGSSAELTRVLEDGDSVVISPKSVVGGC